MELSAEVIGRDGGSRPFRVTCERTLQGLQGGLERLQGEVSAELSRLVEEERRAGAPQDQENEEEEDDDDDSKNGILSSSPPAKRTKSRQS
ncbi:EKC/KEOPS complex subunit GON7-like [Ranitomeya imitator]|uniref:EKC/KEOPS complex subunit GON7-like n=1 Tax=Ranitomeya imitator TaxID=111125 RepID=UPI0037E83818